MANYQLRSKKSAASKVVQNEEAPFVQVGPCVTAAPKLSQCIECKNFSEKDLCRFSGYRKLQRTSTGLNAAGFCEIGDSSEDDLKIWLPGNETEACTKEALLLLEHLGDIFCSLVEQEKAAIALNMAKDKTITWKRIHRGIRDMCDVCETTLFNLHWVCGKCGFMICIECYKEQRNGSAKSLPGSEDHPTKDSFGWLLCANRRKHKPSDLMLTQIVVGDSLYTLGQKVHKLRKKLNIQQHCDCLQNKSTLEQEGSNETCIEDYIQALSLNGLLNVIQNDKLEDNVHVGDTKILSWVSNDILTSKPSHKNAGSTTLKELLSQAPLNTNCSLPTLPGSLPLVENSLDKTISLGVKRKVVCSEIGNEVNGMSGTVEIKNFKREFAFCGRSSLPNRVMTLGFSKQLYPDVPHRWLCDGRLLQLTDPTHPGNSTIFQDHWKYGQPVVVSGISELLEKSLWTPESFSRDFGYKKTDFVNCVSGMIVPDQPMHYFWDGFENISKRLKDATGKPMVLKLKDWPPGEDFSEILPFRFEDLMQVLPMPEYTHRSGKLNLAHWLPDCFVRPDLGPKMYNAYGSAVIMDKGTTNLHLDISDAVNVMVYVGIPKDGDGEQLIKEAFTAIDEAGCDMLMRQRVHEGREIPGALWHIYNPKDADCIRDLLNKESIEHGIGLSRDSDSIHDQGTYLDGRLRKRLYEEYGVLGYPIIQCLGDAVFIPAGAPHQVRNLLGCVKVAEDFVSPENLHHCLNLTNEFRYLSHSHSNHEDKLQAKSILYHAIKYSLAVLGNKVP